MKPFDIQLNSEPFTGAIVVFLSVFVVMLLLIYLFMIRFVFFRFTSFASRTYINKFLTRLIKEREKRPSAEVNESYEEFIKTASSLPKKTNNSALNERIPAFTGRNSTPGKARVPGQHVSTPSNRGTCSLCYGSFFPPVFASTAELMRVPSGSSNSPSVSLNGEKVGD